MVIPQGFFNNLIENNLQMSELLIPPYYPPQEEEAIAQPDMEFSVLVSQTLSKSAPVHTKDYTLYYDEQDHTPYYNTQCIDWNDTYHKEHYSVIELLKLFASHLQNDIDRYGNTINSEYYKELIEECNGWVEDESEAMQDNPD